MEDVADTPAPKRTADPVLRVAVLLALAAAACAAWFGWSWYSAGHDGSLKFSQSRDDALQAGEQGVLNMNTLDYRQVDQGLSRWVSSTTGDLQQQISQGRTQFESQVMQAKTITTAKILDGGVVELDDRAGTATVIVAVQITVTPQSGRAATKLSRMQAQLSRTAAGWKLSALAQAPTGNSN
jgi:Mce-associated membrane protein